MSTRRQGREAAFQLIYQMDLSGAYCTEAVEEFFNQMGIPHKVRAFATELVSGTMSSLEEIDNYISVNSHHWKLHRMNSVDKNILRLGIHEILSCRDTPTRVIINEAIEIGKKYGTSESGSFINGILDKVAKEVRGEEG